MRLPLAEDVASLLLFLRVQLEAGDDADTGCAVKALSMFAQIFGFKYEYAEGEGALWA